MHYVFGFYFQIGSSYTLRNEVSFLSLPFVWGMCFQDKIFTDYMSLHSCSFINFTLYLKIYNLFILNFLVFVYKKTSFNDMIESNSCGHILAPKSLLGFHQFVVIYPSWISILPLKCIIVTTFKRF